MTQQIKRKPFIISLNELSGAFGDLGLLIPFSISLVLFSGVNPVGLLFGIGITNILLGLIYTYPIALQPMKAIGTTAITENFNAAQVGGAGFGCGVFWLIASLFIDIDKYAKKIPKSVSYGISVGLALTLGVTAIQFMGLNITPLALNIPTLLMSLVLFAMLVLMVQVRKFPAVLVLLGVGIGIAIFSGAFTFDMIEIGIYLPSFFPISIFDIIYGFVVAGLAQIVMTAASAVIATKDVIDQYWPNSKLRHKHLTLNMGVMNSTIPWIGGIPLCHGVGGVVAKKTFGSNSGTSLIFEGIFELVLGLLFGGSVLLAFQAFPIYVLGVLLFFTAISLGKVGLSVERRYIPVASLLTTALLSVFARIPLAFVGLNPSLAIPLGFTVGWIVYLLLDPIEEKKNPRQNPTLDGPTMC